MRTKCNAVIRQWSQHDTRENIPSYKILYRPTVNRLNFETHKNEWHKWSIPSQRSPSHHILSFHSKNAMRVDWWKQSAWNGWSISLHLYKKYRTPLELEYKDSGEHNTECVIYDPSNNKIKNNFILRKSKLTFITNGKGLLMIFETKKSFTMKYRNKKNLLATSFFNRKFILRQRKI